MPVFKNKTQGQYVNVYKDILKNHSLSLRDRGMVVTLLSLPDNWEFTISGLSKIIPDGKSSIRASLTHLEELGYISRTQERAECGKFGKIAIEIHELQLHRCLIFGKRRNRKPIIRWRESRHPKSAHNILIIK